MSSSNTASQGYIDLSLPKGVGTSVGLALPGDTDPPPAPGTFRVYFAPSAASSGRTPLAGHLKTSAQTVGRLPSVTGPELRDLTAAAKAQGVRPGDLAPLALGGKQTPYTGILGLAPPTGGEVYFAGFLPRDLHLLDQVSGTLHCRAINQTRITGHSLISGIAPARLEEVLTQTCAAIITHLSK